MQDWTAPLIIERAEGNELIDVEGRRYLDGVSSLWANVHGHRHPALDQAIRAQLDRVAHSTLLGLSNVPSIELAARLAAIAPRGLSRVFYSDSGSTAAEVAVKMAFAAQVRRDPKRTRFLALREGYHGDTLGSVSIGGMDLFHALYKPLLFDAVHIVPTFDALEAAFAEHGAQLAAFVVEPLVQGAAGMLLQPPGFLRRARQLCSQHGVLLICDEVATGFGRTGRMFACEHEEVAPDLLCVAKGLTGGYLPLAATLATDEIYAAFLGDHASKRTFFHGHTYTGNPLACAVALASLDVFEQENVVARVGEKSARLATKLAAEIAPLAAVGEIRQRGLMIGIELVRAGGQPYTFEDAIGARVCAAVRKHGVILRPLGPVVVLMPPLSITDGEIDKLVAATRAAIVEICL
jgi:adenosylmethionine-8-amino-7-oxononanoate aminotransferase